MSNCATSTQDVLFLRHDQRKPADVLSLGRILYCDKDVLLALELLQKACFVPTKSDAVVVGFRKWLNKYTGSQVDWRGKFSAALPPTPSREQLMDRYWTRVVSCSSCKAAYKGLNVLEIVLQVISIALIGIVAATKQSMTSMVAKTATVSTAILCFAASKWSAHFIYKIFHPHDYNHAFV